MSGDIYMKMRDIWNDNFDKNYNRDSAKRKLLAILNSPAQFRGDEKELLKSEYPNVIKTIDTLDEKYEVSYGNTAY